MTVKEEWLHFSTSLIKSETKYGSSHLEELSGSGVPYLDFTLEPHTQSHLLHISPGAVITGGGLGARRH